MTDIDRRRFLANAGVAALLPWSAAAMGATAGGPTTGLGAANFAPPAGPMLYTRTLRRVMVDGAAMSATRFFTVRFVPRAEGYTIEGEETREPVVEAPSSLETFARLERQRRENRMFPMRLDRAGQLVAQSGSAGSRQLDTAIDEALHRVAASGRTTDDVLDMRTFILGLQQAAAAMVAAPPADLFRPLSAPFNLERAVPLPGGGSGRVEVSFTARLDPASGLMREAERRVLTHLESTERVTDEHWTLSPA